MTVGKEMFLDVDGKQVEMEMTECQLAVSSKGVMQRLERSIDRRAVPRSITAKGNITHFWTLQQHASSCI